MDIILKKDVEKLGFKNEIVSVKNGFGRNYLIPKGLGVLATGSAVKILNENLKQQEQKDNEQIAEANKMAEAIASLEVIIKAKVSEGGKKIFGSIKISQLVDFLSELGYNIDPKFVKLPSIKELGEYEAEVRLHRSVKITISFKVVAE